LKRFKPQTLVQRRYEKFRRIGFVAAGLATVLRANRGTVSFGNPACAPSAR
jgi:hypothetical protein